MVKEVTITLTNQLRYDELMHLVEQANQFKSYILIHYKHLQINAKSKLSMRILVIPIGEQLTILAEGDDADHAIEFITSYFINRNNDKNKL